MKFKINLLYVLVIAQTFISILYAAPLKVGVVLPLTGEFSSIGIEIQRGMQLALKETKDSFQVVFEDDNFPNKLAAVAAVQKLSKIDNVSLILLDIVNTAPAIAPIVNQKQIPTIIVWDSNNKVTSYGSYFYAMGYSTELAGQDMAKFVVHNLKASRVAVVSANDEWSEIISSAFNDQAQIENLEIVLHQKIDPSETDHKTLSAKIVNSNAKAVYCPLFGSSLVSFIKQLKLSGFKGSILTGDSFADHDIGVLGNLSEDVYVTQIYLKDQEFYDKYSSEFGSVTAINLGFAALGYDAIKLTQNLYHSLKESGEEKDLKDSLKSQLNGLEYSGYTGKIDFRYSRVASDRREGIFVVKNRVLEKVDLNNVR